MLQSQHSVWFIKLPLRLAVCFFNCFSIDIKGESVIHGTAHSLFVLASADTRVYPRYMGQLRTNLRCIYHSIYAHHLHKVSAWAAMSAPNYAISMWDWLQGSCCQWEEWICGRLTSSEKKGKCSDTEIEILIKLNYIPNLNKDQNLVPGKCSIWDSAALLLQQSQ